jgi:hypothetical protein
VVLSPLCAYKEFLRTIGLSPVESIQSFDLYDVLAISFDSLNVWVVECGFDLTIGDDLPRASTLSRSLTRSLGAPRKYVSNFMPQRDWFVKDENGKKLGKVNLNMQPGGVWYLYVSTMTW